MLATSFSHKLLVGDNVLFNHHGTIDRAGVVVKVTPSAVHIEWVAPSYKKVRVVRVSCLRHRPVGAPSDQEPYLLSDLECKNVRRVVALRFHPPEPAR